MRKLIAVLATLMAGTMMLVAAPVPAQAASYTLPAVCKGKKGKLLCASKTDRKLYAIYNGRVIKYGDARFGGRASDGSGPWFTREGTFKVNWKQRARKSTLYNVWMYDVMNFSGGQHIHYSPEFNRYGWKYGSHGCVGLRYRSFSSWLYDWSPVGTRVIVTKY